MCRLPATAAASRTSWTWVRCIYEFVSPCHHPGPWSIFGVWPYSYLRYDGYSQHHGCIVTAEAAPWRQSACPSRGLGWYARLQILLIFWRCQVLRVAVGQVSVASTTIWWAYLVPHPPPFRVVRLSTTQIRNGGPRGLTHRARCGACFP